MSAAMMIGMGLSMSSSWARCKHISLSIVRVPLRYWLTAFCRTPSSLASAVSFFRPCRAIASFKYFSTLI
ncbi:hypothetical protein RSP795_08070 [Ralstonia solanacearum]|nr:hypothetical protein RSP795_08070 [Ralstonia solanacearum]